MTKIPATQKDINKLIGQSPSVYAAYIYKMEFGLSELEFLRTCVKLLFEESGAYQAALIEMLQWAPLPPLPRTNEVWDNPVIQALVARSG